MGVLGLVLKEMGHRKMNFILSALAVAAAVASFVFLRITGEASKRETRRVMRDMGFNLRIIPKNTDMSQFWADGFSEETMPEEYVYRFASQKGLYYTHLVATLHKRITWRGKQIILTGILPEVCPPDKKKPPMTFSVDPGKAFVGYEIARSLGIKRGDRIEIGGVTFTVERVLPESGSDDDIRIYGHLHDVQKALGLEGRINEIKALECVCYAISHAMSPPELRAALREQLSRLLPDAKLIEIRSIAAARLRQRWMVERYFRFAMPFIVVICAVWIGALAMMNVRERRYEIGIMRALGYGSGRIASLFLIKAAFIGVIGAAVGYAAGTLLALKIGPEVFKVTAKAIKPDYTALIWSLIGAPIFSALSSFIPSMIAVTQDPALILREG